MKDKKPFKIDKRQVYKAYKAVQIQSRARREWTVRTLKQFETDWKRNRLLQDLESNEFGELFSATCSRCLHTQEEWRRADFGSTHCESDRIAQSEWSNN